MNIKLMSDIHLEYNPKTMFQAYVGSGETLILAGDITDTHNIKRDFEWITSLDYEHIIFVCGNHEFYHGDLQETREKISDIASKWNKLHFLDNDTVEIDGIKFIGTTLWTNYDNENPVVETACMKIMNDFYVIDNGARGVSIEDFKNENKVAKKFLTDELTNLENPEKTVVITHHTPSWRSCSKEFQGSLVNGSFHNKLDELIMDTQPKYWCHGHTHSVMDYNIGDTNVMCNPLGLRDIQDSNTGFNINWSINI